MLASLLLFTTLAIAQDAPLLGLPADVPELRKLSPAGSVSFPVVFSAEVPPELRLLEVRLGAAPLAGVPFSIELKPDAVEGVGALEITATGPGPILPGEYTLQIEANADGRQTRLPLRVVVPAAQLRVVPNPAVLDVVKPMFGRETRQSDRALDVYELGQERGIAALLAAPSGNAVGAEGTLGDALLAPISAIALEPGASGALTLEVLNNAPLGTSSVNLELRAPELETAVSVPLELRVRRPGWLLLAVAFLGASMQLLQKMILPWINTRYAEDAQTRELRGFIERELQWRDAALREELEAARKQLPRLFSASNPLSWPSRQEDLDAVRGQLALAVGAFDQRVAATRARLTELFSLVSRRFQLPGTTRVEMQAVAAHHDAARAALAAQDTDEAAKQLEAANAALARALNTARGWADAVAKELEGLRSTTLPSTTPASLRTQREATVAALRDDAITGDALVTDYAVTERALVAIHKAKRLAKALASAHRFNLVGAAERIQLALREDARRAFDGLWKAPEDPPETVKALASVRASASSLLQAVTEALRVLRGGELAKETQELLLSGQYEAAIRAAGVSCGGREGPDTFSEPPAEAPAEPEAAHQPTPQGPVARDRLPDASTTAQRSVFVTLIETALSITLLGGLVWTSYADKFVGTTEELLAVFAFAYGANLGLDPLLGQLTGRFVKKEPDPAQP